MKLFIEYMPKNWNEYINIERANRYAAAKLKKKEKEVVMEAVHEKYLGDYPVKLTFRPHYKNRRQDLDNFRYKGLLDGLVAAGVLKNDNLTCVREITLKSAIDGRSGVEIEIKPIEKDAN